MTTKTAEQLQLIPEPLPLRIGAHVLTPDGPGVIQERRCPGEWAFDQLIADDDGLTPSEPVCWVRTSHHAYAWYLESTLTPITREENPHA